jgi:hypothetical protein
MKAFSCAGPFHRLGPSRNSDHNGQQLAYVYFEHEPGRRSKAKLLTRDEGRRIAISIAIEKAVTKKDCGALAVVGTWRTVARKATPKAFYGLVLSLITFLGMTAVIEIEATRTRLFLVVAVVGVAFSAACFLERLLRDYMRTTSPAA